MNRSSHWYSGIVGIFIAAIIIFLAIYFFVPEVSQKFFGISFGEVDDIADAIMMHFEFDGEGSEKIKDYLSSDSGKDVLKKIVKLSKDGNKAVGDILNNPDVKKIFDNAVKYAEAGLGTVEEYVSDHMDELKELL